MKVGLPKSILGKPIFVATFHHYWPLPYVLFILLRAAAKLYLEILTKVASACQTNGLDYLGDIHFGSSQ